MGSAGPPEGGPYVGDVSLTEDFLAMAAPFRYPDAFHHDEVREIRRIKARVEAERLPQGADASRHLKLGRGSLSDVEWAVQLLQLQHGHAHPDIRTASTLQALEAIEAHGLLSASDIAQLKEAWLLASRIRTALALFWEPSTDVLPSDRAGLEGAARLMGFPAQRECAGRNLLAHHPTLQKRVRARVLWTRGLTAWWAPSHDRAHQSLSVELDAVVELELEGVRTLSDRHDFVLTLELNPGFDEVLGEDATGEQEVVVVFEGDQSLFQ